MLDRRSLLLGTAASVTAAWWSRKRPRPTPAPTPTPTPTPTSSSSPSASATPTETATAPTGEITHGFQINPSNTGHTAYFDSGLGRLVTDSDLTVYTSRMAASDFVSDGGTISRRWFKGGITMDRNNVTLVACRFDQGVGGYYGGTSRRFTLNWCTIDTPGSAGDDGVYYDSWTAYRCRIGGSSDGGKVNGDCVVTECYIRCEQQSTSDHNDGLQNYAGSGPNVVQRCNIDGRPVGGTLAGTSALFVADGATGLQTWHDNFLLGGGYTMRCHEDATYNVQGNWVLNNSWQFGPASRAVIPQSNLTWGTVRPNRVVDASGNALSVISAP